MTRHKTFIALSVVVLLAAGAILSVPARAFIDHRGPDGQEAKSGVNANPPLGVWLASNVGDARETIGFDGSTNSARFVLPRGIRSADGMAYWAAFRSGGMTVLHSFDVTTGSIRASMGLEGEWELGAVAATGKWLALERVPSEAERAEWAKANAWRTTVAVVDAETLKTTRTATLDGNFDVDALNLEGNKLYLIEHLPALKPDHYQVRMYDVALGKLTEGVLVDKRNIDEVMAGYPWDAVGSADGQWLFTLYVGMTEGHAFIHALNLKEGYAWCIDLPSGDGAEETLEHYTLALAPDGHTIYASNAMLGTLAIADVNNIGEPRVVSFSPNGQQSEAEGAPLRSSLVTPDGKSVILSDGAGLWHLDLASNRVQELERAKNPILALAVDAHGGELYVAHADHTVTSFPLTANTASTQVTSSNAGQQGECPATRASERTFVAPLPYPQKAPYGDFWYGNEKLWTMLPPDGKWQQLQYGEKVFWWSQGYVGTTEPQPALQVTGRRLDAEAPKFVATGATNAHHSDFGGWAMLTGVDLPTAGCWEITGEYRGESLSFVVQVSP